jgi:hypothetical protein
LPGKSGSNYREHARLGIKTRIGALDLEHKPRVYFQQSKHTPITSLLCRVGFSRDRWQLKDNSTMENTLLLANTVTECIIEPGKKCNQPPLWLKFIEYGVQFLKFVCLFGQLLACLDI